MTEQRTCHWQNVYSTKADDGVSWFEQSPALSLELIAQCGIPGASVIDVGGGASRLVDALIANGHRHVAVLDLSANALDIARKRLGSAADGVAWIIGDVTEWRPSHSYDIWHDRAALHFLNTAEEQAAYARAVHATLMSGGFAIIGTFAPDGPERCSGLPVTRHDTASVGRILGEDFAVVEARNHDHRTPGGAVQKFQFNRYRKRA